MASRPPRLAETVYRQLKDDIADFRLLPGDRFSEGEVAARLAVSRTPVRQALDRLQQEGYLQVHFRSGWEVLPFEFERFEALYDLRIVLERAAIERLCEAADAAASLVPLCARWQVSPSRRSEVDAEVAAWDEAFHCELVAVAGNPELARVHREVSERIRVVRRLDFGVQGRIAATYEEHAAVLAAILRRDVDDACARMTAHIAQSRAQVRQVTAARLRAARCVAGGGQDRTM